jgi:TrpR-related protein YerC/YecD
MYKSKTKSPATDDLYKSILKLKTLEDCYRFFDDLCTINEIHSFSQRFEVAKLLAKGERFSEVADMTGASTATISRVNRCLQYGADGYKIVLEDKE